MLKVLIEVIIGQIFILNFCMELILDKYDSYLFSYPTNIFINKNSSAYKKISNSLKKTKASKCNF